MSNKNESLNYTYSAQEQSEAKKIMQKYSPQTQQESKAELLRRLDRSVTNAGKSPALTLGIISSLVLGTGMALIMEFQSLIVLGLLLGIIGIIGMVAAYPLYKSITKKERERLTPQILQLSKELIQ
jgi:hypothetical protein